MRVIGRRDAMRLIGAPDTSCPSGLRNRLALELMYHAGLTASEIVGARRDDLDVVEGTITTGGGQFARRTLALQPGTIDLARRWLHEHPDNTRRTGEDARATDRQTGGRGGRGWLLPTISQPEPGGQMHTSYLREMVSREAESVGIPADDVSPQILRDSLGVELSHEGFSPEDIQALLGFADRRAADKYARAAPPDLGGRLAGRAAQPTLPQAAEPEVTAADLGALRAEIETGLRELTERLDGLRAQMTERMDGLGAALGELREDFVRASVGRRDGDGARAGLPVPRNDEGGRGEA